MKVKYYSELLKTYFDDEKECLEKEKEFNRRKEIERKKNKDREARFLEVQEAVDHAYTLMDKFNKDYPPRKSNDIFETISRILNI